MGLKPRNGIIRLNLRKINLATVLRLMSLPGVHQIAGNLPPSLPPSFLPSLPLFRLPGKEA